MSPSIKTYLLVFALLAACMAAGYASFQIFGVKQQVLPQGFAAQFKAVESYDPAKTVPSMTLHTIEGEKKSFSAMTGKWRLVNFWATWCPPCLEEIPLLLSLNQRYKGQGFEVVFVSFDFPSTASMLQEKMKKSRIPSELSTFYVTDPDAWNKFGINGLPTSILVGPNGRIHYKLVGDIDWMGDSALSFFDNLSL